MWWTEALAKAGCHMTKFFNICERLTLFVGKSFQLYWKIWSCDNKSLPGPSTSHSTTEALGTRFRRLFQKQISCKELIYFFRNNRNPCTRGKSITILIVPTCKKTFLLILKPTDLSQHKMLSNLNFCSKCANVYTLHALLI